MSLYITEVQPLLNYKLFTVYNVNYQCATECEMVNENTASNFTMAAKISLSNQTPSAAAPHSTTPICSPSNSTISGTV